jgi:hypothetical protein
MVFSSGEIGQGIIKNNLFRRNRYILTILLRRKKELSMNEHAKGSHSSAPQQVDLDMYAVLKKIQQQLAFLEKKVDTLIRQTPERPPFRERSFQKPFRPGGFSHSHGHGKGEHSQGPRERSFDRTPRSFDKPRTGERPDQERGRKAFFRRKMRG